MCRKVLQVSFQDEEELRQALKYNVEHDKEFIIESNGNLVDVKVLSCIPLSKYEMFFSYENKICFKWKDKEAK